MSIDVDDFVRVGTISGAGAGSEAASSMPPNILPAVSRSGNTIPTRPVGLPGVSISTMNIVHFPFKRVIVSTNKDSIQSADVKRIL